MALPSGTTKTAPWRSVALVKKQLGRLFAAIKGNRGGMSEASLPTENPARSPERRAYPRQPIQSLAYVDLGEGNGGVVLNVSEGGMAVQAIVKPMSDDLPRICIQRSQSNIRIEVTGQIAWSNDVRRLVGVRFIDLPEQDRQRIEEWISSESPQSSLVKKTPAIEAVQPPWHRDRQRFSKPAPRTLTVARPAPAAARPKGNRGIPKQWPWLLGSVAVTAFSFGGFFLLHGRRPFSSFAGVDGNPKTSQSRNRAPAAAGRGVIEPASLVSGGEAADRALRKRGRATGSVDVRFKIDAHGAVEDIQVIKGPAVLARAAIESLGDRKYRPTLVDGVPVETEASETFDFKAN